MPLARAAVVLAVALAACSPGAQRSAAPAGSAPATLSSTAAAPPTAAPPPTEPGPATPAPKAQGPGRPRPPWLGTRVLPRRPDGYGEIRPTPRVLRDRRLVTVDRLPPPTSAGFSASVDPVPRRVLRRSTWSPRCPVGRDDLRYVTVTFFGFDDRAHTGELLVNAAAAEDVVQVFRRLYRARFPIEEMRVVDRPELTLPPTGDGNNTTSFVCRPSRGSTSWSQHAYGLAIDVNPFHNPYVKGDVVLPELASAYVDRSRRRPGMHLPGGVSVRAFRDIGWQWGGEWTSPKDYMHFSSNGR